MQCFRPILCVSNCPWEYSIKEHLKIPQICYKKYYFITNSQKTVFNLQFVGHAFWLAKLLSAMKKQKKTILQTYA